MDMDAALKVKALVENLSSEDRSRLFRLRDVNECYNFLSVHADFEERAALRKVRDNPKAYAGSFHGWNTAVGLAPCPPDPPCCNII
ncbi:unnamed protein product [Rotaria sp. Silwood2]|nr:unnamed protein product [Rotaria sp. Silwood2]CAF4568773.1 unnamed protein product [Rotaria sp. Silwood2]